MIAFCASSLNSGKRASVYTAFKTKMFALLLLLFFLLLLLLLKIRKTFVFALRAR